MALGASRKKILDVLSGKAHGTPPIWLMRQAGRYLPEYRALRSSAGSFLNLCLDPVSAAEVTLQPVRRFGLDAAILFSDILMVPYGLGQPLEFRAGEGPVLQRIERVGDLDPPAWRQFRARTAPVMEAVRRVRDELPEDVTLIGFAGSPWTVAAYMVEGGSTVDFAKVKRWMYHDPAGFSSLMEILVEFTVDYLDLQIEAGAEAVQLFDSWAGVLAAPGFERWVLGPNGAIIDRLKTMHPEVPIILFPRGAGLNYEAFVDGSGADGLGLDATVPLPWARDRLQTRHAIQGNLDPLLLLIGGAALEREVRRICDAFRAGPFIFNLGHGVLPETPPEHVSELVRLVRS